MVSETVDLSIEVVIIINLIATLVNLVGRQQLGTVSRLYSAAPESSDLDLPIDIKNPYEKDPQQCIYASTASSRTTRT